MLQLLLWFRDDNTQLWTTSANCTNTGRCDDGDGGDGVRHRVAGQISINNLQTIIIGFDCLINNVTAAAAGGGAVIEVNVHILIKHTHRKTSSKLLFYTEHKHINKYHQMFLHFA